MLSELHNLNLKLCNKQYNKMSLLHLIVVPQLSSGWGHNYSTNARPTGRANKQLCILQGILKVPITVQLTSCLTGLESVV
jgi:hypothetical protein